MSIYYCGRWTPQLHRAQELSDIRGNKNDVKAGVGTHIPTPELTGVRKAQNFWKRLPSGTKGTIHG